jgi:hypothetical protein
MHPGTRVRSRLIILTLLVVSGFRCANAAADERRQRRLIYNSDADNMFIHTKPPMKPADVFKYVDEVADSGCTSLFMCACYGMPMNYPSKIVEMFGSDLTPAQWKEINEVAADKAVTMERAAVNLRELVKAGHDPLGLIIARASQKNLEVFISFRMNEVHHANMPDVMPSALLITRYWREHTEWHIGKPGDKLTSTYTEIISSGPRPNPAFDWLPGALNYAVPEVRKLRLDQLRECCERFPIDGLDLDFQRFPMYFRPGEDKANVATMTSFIRQVRDVTQEIGRQRGRPLLLSVRVMPTPEQALAIGLDPVGWAREGLIDIVSAGHFLRPTYPVAIADYRKALPANVPLYGSIDLHGTDPATRTAEHRTFARQFWKDGADGILIFNFFTTRERGIEPDWPVLKELGDPAEIRDKGE